MGVAETGKRLRGLWSRNRAFLLFVVALLLVRGSFADQYLIPSGSMEPTLLVGDYILVDRTAYHLTLPYTSKHLVRTGEPRRGDVVVFTSPEDGARVVKRLIAVPGDRVRVRDGWAFVNEREEATAVFVQRLPEGGFGEEFEFAVPPDHFFMMGDNRDNSRDSRFFGFVPRRNLIGRAHHLSWSWAGFSRTWHLPIERFGRPLPGPERP